MRTLLVEDDPELRMSIAAMLRSAGMAVDEAGLAAEADEQLRVHDYDVAVLDRCLPDGDMATLLPTLRAAGVSCPALLLTAMDGVDNRVGGLNSGADDYLVKPFAMAELLARVRALARRARVVDEPVLCLGDLRVDPGRVCATRGERVLTLTPKEFAVLAHLVRNSGRVVSRAELLEHCWDEFADPSSNVIDVRIRLLRAKIGEPPLLHTVRGAGYLADLSA
jgi:two-component system copper resistance phosphate regulon response regulator CusR